MSEIAPFRGVRFDPEKVSSIARVVAPPYDVVDPALEAKLTERHEHNVIRLTMGKTPPQGRREEDCRRAADLLARWRSDGVLIQDEEPCLYVVEQAFTLGGEEFVRRGFIAAVKLEEFGQGNIHPHERTVKAPRSDRLQLLTACRANLSQVLAMYSDPGGAADRLVEQLAPGAAERLYAFEDDDGVRHVVSRLSNLSAIAELAALMRERPLFIADGHHRYESALRYRAIRSAGKDSPVSGPDDYLPVLCVSAADPGLKILPTHRCVRRGTAAAPHRELAATLGPQFSLIRTVVARDEDLVSAFEKARNGEPCVGCYLAGGLLYLLSPTDAGALRARFPKEAELWWHLPVSVLHYVILPDLLGIQPGSPEESQDIEYRKDTGILRDGVEAGRYAMGFLLPATAVATIERVAAGGQRLPPKSTYFYPKIGAGLVIYPHEPGAIGHA